MQDPTTAYLKLVLPSRIPLLELAHGVAERAAAAAGLSEDQALDLGMAVREAVVNAMIHGNRLDPERPVDLVLLAGEGSVRARVRDRGEGFDPQATADPTDPANLLRTSGRGLLLIRAFVDEVGFRFRPGRGMEVTLFKRGNGRPDGGPGGRGNDEGQEEPR